MAIGDMLPRRYGSEREGEFFAPVERELERLSRGFLPELRRGQRSALGGVGFAPKVNVTENDKEILVRAELPGVEEKDIEVNLTPEGLLIRGEKREEQERSEGEWRYVESSYGAFQRLVPINAEVHQDQIEASFDKGILSIRLPKNVQAGARFRKIPLSAGQKGKQQKETQH